MSFEIKEGEFVAIMGPSGSGKSTLLHILGFLDDQTKGTYHFNGKKISDYTGAEIAHIRNKEMGFVFQAFNLLPRTTVYDNVKLPLVYSDFPKKEWDEMIMEAIKIVGLEHRVDYETSQLSGGEKQRVAIARALVTKPKVIFADEPTGNLDSKSGQKIMETLQKLNKDKGHTIILITHETYTAEHAERIIKIVDGKVKTDKRVRKRHDANHGFKK
jgi:putative ABC transport system ATP-binding protein